MKLAERSTMRIYICLSFPEIHSCIFCKNFIKFLCSFIDCWSNKVLGKKSEIKFIYTYNLEFYKFEFL